MPKKFFVLVIVMFATFTFAQPSSANSKDAAAIDSTQLDSLPPIEKMPELVEFIKADYPPELAKKGVEGTVLLELIVNDSGRVDSAAVVQGIDPQLDSAVVAAVRKFVFSPAIAGGAPVAVMMEYAYRITLDEVVKPIEQYVNFKGKLLQRGTRSPVTGAMVIVTCLDSVSDTALSLPFGRYLQKIGNFAGQKLEGNSIITTSDEQGTFSFVSLPACSVQIKIIAPSYEAFTDKECVVRGIATDVLYRLSRVEYGDNEIVVYGKQEKKEVAKQSLTLSEVRRVPGFGGDAVKVIQALPGVARAAFGGGQIIVRGSGDGDSRYYLDGVEIPSLYHFGGLKSTYNSDALQTVDFYPGGFGTRFGGAIAGVVELKTRVPKSDRFHGYADVNLFDASLMVEGPITKQLSFMATYRRSYIAEVITGVLNALGLSLPFTTVPYYWDYIGRLDYTPAKNHHLSLTIFGAQDRLDILQTVARGSSDIDDNTSQATLDDIFNMGYASWDWDISSTMRNELRYGLTRTQSNISIFGFFKTTGDGYKNAIRDQFSWQVDPKLSLFGGCDITAWPYDHFIAAPTPDGSIVRDTTHYFFGPAGVYASAEWKPIDNLTLMPGIRFDYYPELDYAGSLLPEFWDYDGFKNNQGISGEPALRLSTRYQLSQGHVVKGSIGTYSETPQPLGQAIHKTWGNPDLPASKAAQYVLGYEWQITDLDFADVQVYRNNQWDLARSPDSIELVADPTLKNYIGNGKGRMMGLEILLRHNQGPRFFGWIAYSLARSERYDYQNQKWAIYEKDILNNLQLVGSWKFPYQWEVGLRGRYTDGYPTTPITGAELNITQNRYVPEYGETNSDRMTPYIGLDMRISKTFIFDSWTLEAYTELINVAHIFRFVKDSKEQPLYEPPETGSYIWNYDYTEKRVLADIPRISFGMRVDF